MGVTGCFSFHEQKNISTLGEGVWLLPMIPIFLNELLYTDLIAHGYMEKVPNIASWMKQNSHG